MPYIKAHARHELDSLTINDYEFSSLLTSGELVYLLSKYIKLHFDKAPCFNTANEILGALEATKLEFYRRTVAPYEDKKIIENGDI